MNSRIVRGIKTSRASKFHSQFRKLANWSTRLDMIGDWCCFAGLRIALMGGKINGSLNNLIRQSINQITGCPTLTSSIWISQRYQIFDLSFFPHWKLTLWECWLLELGTQWNKCFFLFSLYMHGHQDDTKRCSKRLVCFLGCPSVIVIRYSIYSCLASYHLTAPEWGLGKAVIKSGKSETLMV